MEPRSTFSIGRLLHCRTETIGLSGCSSGSPGWESRQLLAYQLTLLSPRIQFCPRRRCHARYTLDLMLYTFEKIIIHINEIEKSSLRQWDCFTNENLICAFYKMIYVCIYESSMILVVLATTIYYKINYLYTLMAF